MSPKKHARSASGENALSHPSTKRAKEVDEHTPFSSLTTLLESTSSSASPKNVLHWFRSKDLRSHDNRGLSAAASKAQEGSGHLLSLYLYTPADFVRHGASPARIDFILESLRELQSSLEAKHIPLKILTAESREEIESQVLDFVKSNDISHVYANMEYEVDELRRDLKIGEQLKQDKVGFEVCHDQTVVVPGEIKTGSGGPQKVFTPYHKAWLSITKEDKGLLELEDEPKGNKDGAKNDLKELFGSEIPKAPDGKSFESEKERDRLRKLWPAGHQSGMERLKSFLKNKVSHYAAHRSEPARDPSSRLSPYFASGVVSVREVLKAALDANGGDHFDDSGDAGIASWVREIVFREFYRHVMVITPHDAMNLPHNLKFDFVQWEEDEEGWKKWCEGRTGVPFVDAGMRQLNTEAYMHNRLRMNTSSYLRANLLIDYRRGERYFAEHLIDWDLSNNTQGWEPSYTIFNPVVQAEKCDKEGEYIRKWVPELASLKGKEIFAPHERLSKEEFEKLGYPRPHVDFSETQQRAKERYKHDLANADP